MKIANRAFAPSMFVCGLFVAATLAIIGFTPSQARAGQAKVEQSRAEQGADDQFKGPSFRKGLWHFVRTIAHRRTKQRLLERETTACVDPTQAMRATFASPSVGSCVSARPEKINNRYVFANRCDYMGPVSTVITVDSEESYTEQNEVAVGAMPRVELVVAKRIGDCQDAAQSAHGPSALSH
jgi:hypothetical protein